MTPAVKSKQADKVKQPRKRKVNHVNHAVPCTQVDNIAHLKDTQTEIKDDIKQIFKIIDGNGSGKGMKVDLALVCDQLEKIGPMLGEIKTRLSSVSEVNTEIEVQSRVQNEVKKAIDTYKETKAKEEESVIKKKSFSWQKFAVTIAALSFLVMAFFQVLNYFKSDDNKAQVIEKIDKLGSPVVTNPRGELVPLPDGYSLKMWTKDFDEGEDTVKKDSIQ
jgi:hypothetical protein